MNKLNHILRKTIWLLAIALLAVVPVQAQWTNNQAAVNVIGQPNVTSNGFAGVTPTSLTFTVGVAVDPATGKVFISDSNIVRVTRYSSAAAMLNGQAAEAVLGQPDLMTAGIAATQNGMNQPNGIFVDGAGRLWVADRGNHRVLRFDNASTKASGANADGVLGQPDFMSHTMGAGSLMQFPQGVTVDGVGRLWVADRGNNRVLRFDNAALKANGAAADGVLGQPDFTATGFGTNATGMSLPENLITDGTGRLWVSDSLNNRVLRFDNAAAKANGGAADGVLGQTNLMSTGGGITQSTMREPSGLSLDPAGRLYVVDLQNHRVLIFNNAATLANGANADNVLGQPGFNTGTANNGGVSATSFNLPFSVFFDPASYSLYVTDALNRRVKRYVNPPCASVTLAALSDPTAGVSYAGSVAASPAGSYTYSVVVGSLPPGLSLDPSTGALAGLATVTGTYNFTIEAQTGSGCSGTQSYTLLVNCPTITLSALPVPSLNTPYNQSVTASPTGSYSFAVTAGALPAGLSLNSATGVVSGTPTVAGAYNFTITATGFGSCTGSQSYSGTISGSSCATFVFPALPSGTVGQAYNNYVAPSPGVYFYQVTAGSLPLGVTLYDLIGLLSGYPSLAGTYSFTIQATDINGCVGTKSYTVVIN